MTKLAVGSSSLQQSFFVSEVQLGQVLGVSSTLITYLQSFLLAMGWKLVKRIH